MPVLLSRFVFLLLACLLAACSTPFWRQDAAVETIAQAPVPTARQDRSAGKGADVVLYALGLIDTGYRFGGKNPQAGLDCSGMVTHIYGQAAGLRMTGSAADLARAGREIGREALQPGDLVFFNTRAKPFSHVGIYIGDERFVHAPNSNGRVRIDRLNDRYYAQRYEAASSFFN